MSLISFAEIVQEQDSSVRINADGLLYAVDFVKVITDKTNKGSSRVLRNLKEDVFSSSKFIDYPAEQGGHPIKCVSFSDALELVMVLHGKRATQFRKQFKDIIVRYLDGDRSMCSEIIENEKNGRIKSYTKFASKTVDKANNETTMKNQGMPHTDYVYATKSAAFPGLIKIGKTQDVKQRLSQLNTACAPAPHVIVAVAPTFNHSRDEKVAHAFFSDKRRAGEFFELDDTEVVAFFTGHITAQYNVELMQNIERIQGSTMKY